jgi:hypothetical protein
MTPTILNFSDVYKAYMEKRYLERLSELRRNENLFSTDYSWNKVDVDLSPLSLPIRHEVLQNVHSSI